VDDAENKRQFIGDADGYVYIMSNKAYPPELIIKVQTNSKACIWSIVLDDLKLYLFACDVEGYISTF